MGLGMVIGDQLTVAPTVLSSLGVDRSREGVF